MSKRVCVAAGIVWLDRKTILFQRRAPTAHHGAGALELPGGAIERGESPAAALARELGEEWGEVAIGLPVGPIVDVVHHIYPGPGPEVLICVYHVDGQSLAGATDWTTTLTLPLGVEATSLAVSRLPVSSFLAADQLLLTRLVRGEIRSPF